VFARPGPYIYAEWRNQGVPDHAAPLNKSDPTYRKKATGWIEAVCAALRPHLASRNGPVFLVQADNESDPAIHVHGESLGLGVTPGPFQVWLRQRYKEVDTLNVAWGTHLSAFEEARAVVVDGIPGTRRAFLDACDFRYHLAADHADFAVRTLRASGIDCPVCLNTWPGHDAQDWWTFSHLADLHGIDPYPANLYRGYAGEHRYHAERFRYLRSLAGPSFIVEFGSGVWRGQETVTGTFDPDHYRLAALTALAGGVTGWNWYMLADRDQWLMAPVTPDGRLKDDLGAVFSAMARILRDLDPASRRVSTSFAAVWSPRHSQTAEIGEGRNRDEVRIALHDLGVAHDFVDVDRDRDERPRVLLYTGPAWLSRAGQEGLLDHVEGGGTLVFHRTLPLLDEDLTPLNLLDLPVPDGTGHPGERRIRVNIGETWVLAAGPTLRYRAPPGRPVQAYEASPDTGEEDSILHLPAGVRPFVTGSHWIRDKGRILILGCAPTPTSILHLLEDLDASPPCFPLTPGIRAALLEGPEAPALILVNPGDEAVSGTIRLNATGLPDGVRELLDLESREREKVTIQGGELTIRIPGRGGRVVLLL